MIKDINKNVKIQTLKILHLKRHLPIPSPWENLTNFANFGVAVVN